MPLHNQPVGAEGSVLGATALVNLEVVVEVTGKSLKVPCYVIDSTKPVWKGDAKNCGMIMGSNALVAFQFRILHANGIEVLTVNSANSLAVDSVTQLESTPADSVEQVSEVMSKHTCAPVGSSNSTVLFECYKPTQLSLHLAELAVLPMQKVMEQTMLPKIPNVSSTKVLVVVLKCTTQVMPGITKWIDVQVQEQSSVTDLVKPDDAVCSTNVEEVSNNLLTPDQCTEQSVPQHLHTSSCLTSLQDTVNPNCLSVIVPTENMVINEQCDFVNGICNCEELSKVPLVNWGTQPQVFKKGTVIGYVEQASIVDHGDSIWKDHWEELPEYSDKVLVRMCQAENHLEELQKQIKISNNCSDEERDQLLNCLLEKNEVFALSDEELGETDVVEHSIDVTGAKPVKEVSRRLPYAMRQQLELELDKLLKIGCIEPANSPYASPLVLVRKPDGSLRLCVDYRTINKDTIPDRYPLPRVDELIDAIGAQKAVYFTTLDLMRGYHRVKMTEESKAKTAFVCHRGLYQFCRMPFGLTNAPATFQRLMDKLFNGWNFVFIYLDDILIASRNFEEHISHVTEVLQRLQDVGLKVKPSKCRFAEKQVDYLGFSISATGVRPTHKNVLAVKEFPQPQTVKEVKRFLGLANFYRRHLQDMGIISTPLTALTKKNKQTGQPVTFEWSNKCEESFQKIKSMLSSSPLLVPPDLDKEFFLWVDTCEDGFGAILEQMGADNLRHPVAYASQATNDAEKKYPPTKLEMVAIVYALNHFEVYLLGHKITVFTDHQALVTGYVSYLKGQSKGLLSRWYLRISQYLPNLIFEYKPGKSNEAADALSRTPVKIEATPDSVCLVMQVVSEYPEETLLQNICTQQFKDKELVNIINYLEKKILPTDVKEAQHIATIAKKGYFVLDGVLYYESNDVPGRRRLVVPEQLRDKVVTENHDAIFSGHFSAKKMLNKLKQYFYWPGMSSLIYKKCESCLICATTQGQERRQNPELQSIPVDEPFSCIGMDFKEMDESSDKTVLP